MSEINSALSILAGAVAAPAPAASNLMSDAEIADLRTRVLRGEHIDPLVLRQAYDQMIAGRQVSSGSAAVARSKATVTKAVAAQQGSGLLELMKKNIEAKRLEAAAGTPAG